MTKAQTQRWSRLAGSIERVSVACTFAAVLGALVLSHWRYIGWRWPTGQLSIWRGGVCYIDTTSTQRQLLERFRAIGRTPWHAWNRWDLRALPDRGMVAVFPLWPCVLVLGMRTGFAWSRSRRAHGPGHCHNRGYDRHGLISEAACPECAARVDSE